MRVVLHETAETGGLDSVVDVAAMMKFSNDLADVFEAVTIGADVNADVKESRHITLTSDDTSARSRHFLSVFRWKRVKDVYGHSAKFGSYKLMHNETNTIVDIQLIQSNEVGGSYKMEKEGLKRCLHKLEVDCIVTDRHPQIQKYLRERRITQFYDVWRFEQGLSKKLEKLSQRKECEVVKKWLKSIKNHVYWSATSSVSGPEKVAKWTSQLNHIQHVHGECTAKPVKTDPTYSYVDDLMSLLLHEVFLDPAPYVEELQSIPIPPTQLKLLTSSHQN
ncbi:uncharacterized protein LOC107730185 [Sinocyclocheilus rhinocerous]|uniref:uncharacterized protein LOC107730185 n=1 Tax=Sinocyclocheilus rhinocerous TaxID=307959 RepID=UPI0007B9B3D3|nr:PREDICTED: uncharacterized protein LOC107730185 [Sinocyclocheilus rhinocerous]